MNFRVSQLVDRSRLWLPALVCLGVGLAALGGLVVVRCFFMIKVWPSQ